MIDPREHPYPRIKRYIRLGYEQNNMDLIHYAYSLIDKNYFKLKEKCGQIGINILTNICKSNIVYKDYIGYQYFLKNQKRWIRNSFGDKLSYPNGRKLLKLKKIHKHLGIHLELHYKLDE